MNEKLKYVIYMHVFPNNKKYIGMTMQTLTERFKNGKGYKSCTAINDALKEFNWDDVEHKILYKGYCTQNEAEFLERKFISWYRTNNPEYGYNLQKGGNAGHDAADITRKRLSDKLSGENNPMYGRSGELNPMYGKSNKGYKHTDEARAKIKEARKNQVPPMLGKKQPASFLEKFHSSPHGFHKVKRVGQYDLEDNLIKIWDSVQDASAALNISESTIYRNANGTFKQGKGFIWKYLEE